MLNWNDLKNLDIKDVDLTKIDLGRFDVRNIDLPKIDFPNVDLPKFEFPKFDEIELPVDVDRVVGLARDTAYAGIGVAVVTAQKVDERRRELTDQVTTQVRKLVDAVA